MREALDFLYNWVVSLAILDCEAPHCRLHGIVEGAKARELRFAGFRGLGDGFDIVHDLQVEFLENSILGHREATLSDLLGCGCDLCSVLYLHKPLQLLSEVGTGCELNVLFVNLPCAVGLSPGGRLSY
jgi:hypothetical protein